MNRPGGGSADGIDRYHPEQKPSMRPSRHPFKTQTLSAFLINNIKGQLITYATGGSHCGSLGLFFCKLDFVWCSLSEPQPRDTSDGSGFFQKIVEGWKIDHR